MNFPVTMTSTARSLEMLEDKKLHLSFIIETYGSQKNSADSEIVRAILLKDDYMPALQSMLQQHCADQHVRRRRQC